MIDGLALHFTSLRFTPSCDNIISRRIQNAPPATFYQWRSDLQDTGVPVILLLGSRYDGHNKLVLVGCGQMVFNRMLQVITQVLECDPLSLRPTRLDLKVDLPYIPLHWFQTHFRVRYKQYSDEFGAIPYHVESRFGVQTLRFGMRPNCVIVYDKIAEARRRRHRIPGLCDGAILTRIERQMGAQELRKILPMLAGRWGLLNFNPFQQCEITAFSNELPDPERFSLSQCARAVYLRELVREYGLQGARQMIPRNSRRNAARLFSVLNEVLPAEEPQLTIDDLFRRYRSALGDQLEL